MKLTSADVIHSFWVPQLAGKTDLLPNRVNEMWIDPQSTGLYVGQCAQFCGMEHAKMLLRVYVDSPEQFQQWIANQQKTQSEISADRADIRAECGNGGSKAPSPMTPWNPRRIAGGPTRHQSRTMGSWSSNSRLASTATPSRARPPMDAMGPI